MQTPASNEKSLWPSFVCVCACVRQRKVSHTHMCLGLLTVTVCLSMCNVGNDCFHMAVRNLQHLASESRRFSCRDDALTPVATSMNTLLFHNVQHDVSFYNSSVSFPFLSLGSVIRDLLHPELVCVRV